MVASGPTFELLRQPEVLRRADLVPPQIVDISMRLVEQNPQLANTPIATANTLEEIVSAVQALAGGKAVAQ